jgi:hypothetical protein
MPTVASPQARPVIQGKKTDVYSIEIGAAALGFLTYGSPERSLSVLRKYAGNTDIFWYDDYEEQPFDAKLFDRPEGINIEEIKPQSKSKNPCAADQTSGKNLLLGLLRFLCVVYSPRFTISPHLGGLS